MQEGGNAPALEQDVALKQPRLARARAREQSLAGAPCGASCRPIQAPQLAPPSTTRPTATLGSARSSSTATACWPAEDGGKVRLVDPQRSRLDRPPAGRGRGVRDARRQSAVLDGELVALRQDGVSSFPRPAGRRCRPAATASCFSSSSTCCISTAGICAPCRLLDRKRVLQGLADWKGMLRFSDHVAGNAGADASQACQMHLEGIVCKRADAAYRAGRGARLGQGEMPGPRGVHRARLDAARRQPHRPRRAASRLLRRRGPAALCRRRRHRVLRSRTGRAAPAPRRARRRPPETAGVPAIRSTASIHWVRPELVAEVQYPGWSGAGRVRHAVYLGLREDKAAGDVVRDIADPAAERARIRRGAAARRAIVSAQRAARSPFRPCRPCAAGRRRRRPRRPAAIVVARPPKQAGVSVGGVELTHPDRELWPGITKHDLAEYWQAVAAMRIARTRRIARCRSCAARTASTGEHFFQKNGHGHLPAADPRRRGRRRAVPRHRRRRRACRRWRRCRRSNSTRGAPARPIRCIPTASSSTSTPARACVRRGRAGGARCAGAAGGAWASRRSAAPPAARGCTSSCR